MNKLIITPEWVKNAIFYQIFPDRFAISDKVEKPGNIEPWNARPTTHGFKGGDLLGIVDHLTYLVDLGINAIYLNPIFQSASNHRYHTHDYFRVDPLLGGDQAFKELLEKAHQLGIKIVIDGVFNHASRGFFQFNHILETGAQSPYLDWFKVKKFPLNAYGPGKPNYACWWNLPALPEFNTANPQVRKFIFSVAKYWIEQGIDGWRLDVPFCIDDDEFWKEFRSVVKSANPDAYIVGEVPWEAQRWLQGDQFDAIMNYQFTQACLGFFAGKRINRELEKGMMGLPSTPVLDAEGFAKRVVELLYLYPSQIAKAQMNLLDSHDMPRFISLSSGDWNALKLAVLFMMTYPGAPCIYYGDEVGMLNGPTNIPEDCRYAFSWEQSNWNTDLHQYYKRCIQLRKQYPALRNGDFEVVHAKGELFAYQRTHLNDALLIVINNGDEKAGGNLPVNIPAGRSVKGLLTGITAYSGDGVTIFIEIAARTGEIFLLS